MGSKRLRFSDSREILVDVECAGRASVLTFFWSKFASAIDPNREISLLWCHPETFAIGPHAVAITAEVAALMLGSRYEDRFRFQSGLHAATVSVLDALWDEAGEREHDQESLAQACGHGDGQ